MILLLVAAPAFADELRLRSGDRLTGTVVSLAEGALRFKTPHGDLTVDWAEVTALTVDDAIVIQGVTGETTRVNGGAIDVATVAVLSRPEPPIVWSGGANLGFLATSGNTDVNSLRADGELVARARANRYTVNALVSRAEDSGRETGRNWTASGRYDRFLTKRLYANGSAIFTNDAFRDLDLRTALGAGLGYQALDATRVRLSAEAGLGWVNEDFGVAEDDSYTALRESARLDMFLLPDRLAFFHQHDGYFGVTGDDNLFVKMQNGVRVSVVAGFVMTAQIDLDYNRSPAPGRRHTDRNFAVSLGYSF